MYSCSPPRGLPTCFETPRLQLLIGEQLLRGLLHLFEQSTVVARLIDRRLQFLAQLGQPLEPLLVREILIQRVFEGHRRPSAQEYVLALSREIEQMPYRNKASLQTVDPPGQLR